MKLTGKQGAEHESTRLGKKSMPQLQDHPPQGRRAHNLHGSASQAASGLGVRGAVAAYTGLN
jgi:hypothetical protein